MRSTMNRPTTFLLLTLTFYWLGERAWAEALEYSATDPALQVVLIDPSPNESYLSVRVDSAGRIFVGGREALFVYEPTDQGGYQPAKELARFPKDSWLNDVEILGDDLYVLTCTALYRIPDGRIKRTDLKPKRLVWGIPFGHVHQCLHALAWGPEGDLYITLGDPLWYYGDFRRPDHFGHWNFYTQPNDVPVPYTGVGGVLRCRPDGSRLQVVARGLRNSCGLCFDSNWNLFTTDNDHEQMPAEYVPGRLLHVTPFAYFSWPRGWMAEKSPDRVDLLETMFGGMGRAVPVGQTFYDETFFPEPFRRNLLVAQWGIRTVSRYAYKPRGASFQAEESTLLAGQEQARPVGVTVGRGGRVFVTIAYMAHNEGSPIYRSDLAMITTKEDPASHPFESLEIPAVNDEHLWKELSNPSWWPRYRAHEELLRRGRRTTQQAISRLENLKMDDPARLHLPWIAGSRETYEAGKSLAKLANHDDPAVRLQVIRVLAEFPGLNAESSVFENALKDSDPQVQLAAMHAYFDIGDPLPKEVIQLGAHSKDSYFRQTAAMLLARRAPYGELEELGRSSDAEVRLLAVLAAGFRLTLPLSNEPISERLPLEPHRGEEAYLIEYADKKVDLRQHGRMGNFTVAEHWAVGERSTTQEALFNLLIKQLADSSEPVRLEAAYFLSLLNDRRSEPKIAKVVAATQAQRLEQAPAIQVDELWVAGLFPDEGKPFETTHPPETGPIDLAASYRTGGANVHWTRVKNNGRFFDFQEIFKNVDQSSSYAFCRLETPKTQRIDLLVGSDDGVKVWLNGRVVHENATSRGALPFQDVVPLELQEGSNDLLIRVQNVSGASGLYLHFKSLERVVASLPERIVGSLADRIKSATQAGSPNSIPSEFLAIDWSKATEAGDRENGKRLFSADGLGCAKCHAVAADQGGGNGPSLADAARRFTVPYLVESILLPDKAVSPVFRSTLIVTNDGNTLMGLVVGETADRIELLQRDATKKVVPKSEIESQTQKEVSPMPHGLVKTPAELRDLLAFLLGK
ncbi:MAG: HEAT repeat domain-containing protein [Planctomycetota bacterium]